MKTTTLRDELERARIRVLGYIRDTPDNVFYKRSGGNSWSVAEAIHHVCLVNESLTTRLQRLLDESDVHNSMPEQTAVDIREELDALDPAWVLANVPAAPSSQPSNDRSKDELRRSIEENYAQINRLVEAGSRHDLRQLSAPHKMLGSLSYYEWLYFIVVHERTHFFQIDRELEHSR